MQVLPSRAHIIAKAGNTHLEIEDVADTLPKDDRPFRAAVADGATECSYSRQWAEIVCQGFLRGCLDSVPTEDVWSDLRNKWSDQVGTRDLPWYAEEKLRLGAACTFVGLKVIEDPNSREGGQFDLVAVGDACAFHVRDNRLQQVFPLSRVEEFCSTPDLLCTAQRPEAGVWRSLSAEWRAGDHLVLMTDAIACWYLREFEAAQTEPALEWGCEDLLRERIADLRERGQLRNDDVTCLRIAFHSDPD